MRLLSFPSEKINPARSATKKAESNHGAKNEGRLRKRVHMQQAQSRVVHFCGDYKVSYVHSDLPAV